MTEPNRIWINDKWEAYLRPTFEGDTSGYIRADLAAMTPEVPTVDQLAQIIRKVDGENTLGAGALAEAILAALRAGGDG